jgi:hypothetical protein
MGQRGRAIVKEDYSIDRVAQNYRMLYVEAMTRRGVAP